jgi:hypothetical protein
MPIKRFWFYHKQVDRLAAEEDLRMLNLLAAVTSSEAYGNTVEKLRRSMGEIYVMMPVQNTLVVVDGKVEELDPEYDRGALLALKRHCTRKVESQE